jgi:D-glycero-D-manno-heptose 1,7-bisphosphate phosphatase
MAQHRTVKLDLPYKTEYRRTAGSPAVFLDRDGTLVYPYHYPSRPEHLRLVPGIGPELRSLQKAGFRLVVITNQSGIARGYFTEADLQRMHHHLQRQLAACSVALDAIFYCPHHPEGAVPELAIACGCRKPQPGLILQAVAQLGLDLMRSWFLGDILDDVEAGRRAGCRTILVDLGTEPPPAGTFRQPDFVARDTCHALRIILAREGLGAPTDLNYGPPTWEMVARGGDNHAGGR